MDMNAITMLRQERTLVLRSIEGLGERELTAVPDGHSNNVLWNLGHIVVVQQLLHYRLSGLDLHIPEEMVEQFKTGTSPAAWEQAPDIADIRSLLVELPERLAEDAAARRFQNFGEYTTSTGMRLNTFEDAIAFNQFHEGVHTGVIMSLRKLV